MGTYIGILSLVFSNVLYAQFTTPTPTPTPKVYLGQVVDESPYSADELEVIRQIEAHKTKVMEQRQELINKGLAKPNKHDIKYLEMKEAKKKNKNEEEDIPVRKVVITPDAEVEFAELSEKRKREREKRLKDEMDAKSKKAKKVTAEATPTPDGKNLTDEEKKYNKEKEEFLNKFKKN
ncbi:MAG: hypothetical protein KC493_15095 [Bacteriovoracaceae bacterium]|nr:hypothetical protein [Bacteriovoracaceae bacterium]